MAFVVVSWSGRLACMCAVCQATGIKGIGLIMHDAKVSTTPIRKTSSKLQHRNIYPLKGFADTIGLAHVLISVSG